MSDDDSTYMKLLRAEVTFNVGPNLGVNGSSEKYFIRRLRKIEGVYTQPELGFAWLKVWVRTAEDYQRSKKETKGAWLFPEVCFKRAKNGFHMFFFPFPSSNRRVCVAGEFDEHPCMCECHRR